jgi:hypothetical protein
MLFKMNKDVVLAHIKEQSKLKGALMNVQRM